MKMNRRNQLAHYAKFLFAPHSWALVVFLLACFAPLHAQQITGTIVGTLKDQTGALVNTATVKATNVDTGFTKTAKKDKQLWGVPHRLSSCRQVHGRGGGRQL